MTRTTLPLAAALLILLPLAAAAQHHGGPGGGPGGGPAADPANAFEVTGPVISFTAAAGAGMPALAVDDAVLGPVDVGLGPAWYLQQAGFSASPGDEVELLAYPCTTCSLPAVAAWVNNLTTGASVELRDDEGYPLWRQQGGGHGGNPRCEPSATAEPGAKNGGGNGGNGGHGGHGGNGGNGQPGSGGSGNGQPGNGPGNGGNGGPGNGGNGGNGGPGNGGNGGPGNGGNGGPGNGGPGNGPGPHGDPGEGPGPHGGQCDWNAPDMSAVATVTGTVVAVSATPGEGMPAMLLATDDGELELLLSPYHPIAAAGFLIEPGMELIVTYAPWVTGGEELFATISITDPVTGLTIQLRDPETGYPLSGGHGYRP